MKDYIYMLVVLATAVFAVRALFLPGFIPTHDGEYHIIRIHEFETMLRNGVLFPRWAPGLNSGYGVPLFNFFYPLPNYIGVLFHQFTGIVDAYKLTLAVGYIGTALACFYWLKRLFDNRSSLVGTVVSIFVPYWFVDIYVRGSVGEVLAICFFMVFLAGIENKRYILATIAVAGIITSHNILAMVFMPVAVGYALMRAPANILRILFGGLGLSAYFWVPALLERLYVSGLNYTNYQEHFPEFFQLLIPSWGSGYSALGVDPAEMSFQFGLVPLFCVGMGVWIIAKKVLKTDAVISLYWMSVFISTAYLMTSHSLWLWKAIPALVYIQFPWRFLSLLIPISGYFAAVTAYIFTWKIVALGLLLMAPLLSLSYTKPVLYEPRSDEYYLSRPNFTDGTSSLGDGFTSVWRLWHSKRAVSELEVISGSVAVIRNLGDAHHLLVMADKPSMVELPILYFPGWAVRVDGVRVPLSYTNGDIRFFIDAGDHEIQTLFSETPVRHAANAISFISLLWLLRSSILSTIYAYRYRHHTVIQ